ncbi:MAG: DUF4249 domain-containing protein [Saprospiraceae bacterium]
MKYFYFILTITILGLLTSCEEEYVFEKQNFVPKVVVNSVFTEGKPFNVHLSYSRDILSNIRDVQLIENAIVSVKEKATGRTEELKNVGLGNYTYNYFTAKADHTYELSVRVPGYETISATSKVPMKVGNVNVLTENLIYNEQEVLEIKFNIQDKNPGYYAWNWIFSDNKTPIDSSLIGSTGKFVTSVSKFRNIDWQAIEDDSNLGIKEGEGDFKKSFYYLNKTAQVGGSFGGPDEKYFLRILSLSKEMFDFYESIEKYIDEESQISSLSYLPKVYSNVHNGLGLFAGYSQKYIEVKK